MWSIKKLPLWKDEVFTKKIWFSHLPVMMCFESKVTWPLGREIICMRQPQKTRAWLVFIGHECRNASLKPPSADGSALR